MLASNDLYVYMHDFCITVLLLHASMSVTVKPCNMCVYAH